jgi:hypothetical protein
MNLIRLRNPETKLWVGFLIEPQDDSDEEFLEVLSAQSVRLGRTKDGRYKLAIIDSEGV